MDVVSDESLASNGSRYTREQIADAISAMSKADRARVVKAAKWFSSRCGTSWRDLSQDAYLRALDTRTCVVGTGMVPFVCGIIRSIASEEPRARERARKECGLEVVYGGAYGDEGLPHPVSDPPSPEDAALSKVLHARQIARAEACLDGDEELQLLVAGEFEGMRGRELEELVGTDTKGLAAAKKRLARKVRAAFAEGSGL